MSIHSEGRREEATVADEPLFDPTMARLATSRRRPPDDRDRGASSEPHGRRRGPGHLLKRPRYEIFPLDGVEDEVARHIRAEVKLTIRPRRREWSRR